jgi:hypothetical protein
MIFLEKISVMVRLESITTFLPFLVLTGKLRNRIEGIFGVRYVLDVVLLGV